jgi:hypothetical protein
VWVHLSSLSLSLSLSTLGRSLSDGQTERDLRHSHERPDRRPPEELHLEHCQHASVDVEDLAVDEVGGRGDEEEQRLAAEGDVERLAAGTDAVWRSR